MLARELSEEHFGKNLYINDQGDVTMGRLLTIEGSDRGYIHIVVEFMLEGRKNSGPIIAAISSFASVRILEPTRQEVNEKVTAIFDPITAIEWLMGNNYFLEGSRPWDFLEMGRYEEVLQALECEIG